MKIRLLLLTLLFSVMSWGQAIISWDFASGNTPNVNLPGGATTLSFNTSGTNATSGCTTTGFSTNNWNVNEYFQIVAPTTGYSITTMTFNVRSSGTGPLNFKVQYSSTGTGGVFTDLGTTFTSSDVGCVSRNADFTSINALDNNANTVIRLVFTGGEADGSPATGDALSSGTFRIDDLIINGSSTCTPPSNPAGTISGTTPACGNTTLSYSAPNANLYWQTSAAGTSTANPTTSTYNVTSTGTYYVRAYDGTSCWSVGAVSYAVTINTVPTVPTTANASAVCQGTAVTFTGTGSTGATSYTFWNAASGGTQYLNGVGGYTVTGTALTTPTALTAATYTYYIQGESASCSGTSRKTVTVVINAIPADPTGSITVSANPSCGSATLSYTTGYYWQTTAGGTSTANPTSSNYTLNATGTIYVRAYSGSCWSTNSINTGSITINAAPTITTQPTNQSAIVGNTATYNVTATGTGLSYQWQVSTDGGTVWGNVGTNSNSYTTPVTTLPMSGYQYKVIVSGTAPCSATTSNAVTLTVNTTPCLAESFAVNALPSGWLQSTIIFASNYAEFSNASGNGDLTMVSVSNPTSLTFTLTRTSNASAKDLIVEVSTTSQTTGFSTVTTYNHSNTTSAGTTNCTVDLSAYTPNSTVYIRFRKASATTSYWRLDDINVYCGTPPPACTTPVTQPTALSFSSVTSTGFNSSFTAAAAPGASGYLVVYSTNATLSGGDLPVSGTSYIAGAAIGDGTVVQSGAGTSFALTGLTPLTTYYVFVFAYNTGGGCSIAYNTASPLSGSQATAFGYCTSVGENISWETSVSNVTLNTINKTSLTKTAGYMDYTGESTNLQRNESYPLSVNVNTDGNYTVLAFAWIDFNHDGDFTDMGESFGLGSATNTANGITTSSPFTITIPVTAALGATTMRVIATYDGDSSPCLNGFDGEVEDYTVNITAACTPAHTVTSFAPTSGPTATEVTITGTGFTAGSTVNFNGITATVVFVNSTTLIATVPAGSTTGNLVVIESGCKLIAGTFTEINQTGACTTSNNLTDLIISEIYDSVGGNSWYMELYNPTSSPIDLDAAGADYKLVRHGDIGTTNGPRTVNITGIIAPGDVYLADLGSDSFCGALGFDFVAKANGINENDEIALTKNDVIVDMVHCPNEKGYTIIRNLAAVGPSATYNAADWTLSTTESCLNLGTVAFTFSNTTPTVNTNPADVVACGNTANFVITATAGSGALTYQWFYNNGVTAGWTSLTTLAGLVITGNTSNNLTLTGTVGSYDGYQFYCQVTEAGTCSVASDAAQLDIIATTWNGSAWSNGAPAIGVLTTINGNYNTTTHGDIDACSLIVNTGFTLTVTANHYLNIQNDLTVNAGGTLDILNNGSLVQVSNSGVNTGNIIMRRTANIKLQDYVYWSSPVSTFAVTNISPGTPSGLLWRWNPTIANANGGQGNWQGASGNMTVGGGYIVRAPNGYTNASATAFTANFTGVPNNGIHNPAISRGSDTGAGTNGPNGVLRSVTDDNWNLLGNPYPSAISISSFLTANANIDGFVRLWTHGTLPSNAISDPYYDNFVSNYTAADYIAINGAGATSGPGTLSVIGAGQGFFVLMNAGAASTSSVVFNNAMRNKTFSNSQFYRTASLLNDPSNLGENQERHRIWLDLVSPSGTTTRTLVAYVEGATEGKDRLYDAITDYKNSQNFYSLINNEIMTIQGRSLPFHAEDKVPMGIKVATSGLYHIGIAAVDGLFANGNQTVYLEDRLLNTVHNLTNTPYQFTANQGVVENRFVLRYTEQSLGTGDFNATDNEVVAAVENEQIHIRSQTEPIKNILVYDVLGRVIFEKNNINATEYSVQNLVLNQQPLIIKIGMENGQTVTRKIIL